MMNRNVPNKKTCIKKSIKIQHKNSILEILQKIQVKNRDFEEEKWFLEYLIQFHLIYFIQVLLFGALSSIT